MKKKIGYLLVAISPLSLYFHCDLLDDDNEVLREIIFTSYLAGEPEFIYSMTAEGANKVCLTPEPLAGAYELYYSGPRFSRDGKKIAFHSMMGIGIMNADGTNREYLGAHGRDPAWSPEGTRIAYFNNINMGGLGMINIESKQQTMIFEFKSHVSTIDTDWSKTGDKIIFICYPDSATHTDLFSINPDGTELRNLTNSPMNEYCGRFSPDGKKIVYITERYEPDIRREIFIVDSDGNNMYQLTSYEDEPMLYLEVCWSPDGRKIIAAGQNRERIGERIHLYILNFNGKQIQQITYGNMYHRFPDWSLVGTQ